MTLGLNWIVANIPNKQIKKHLYFGGLWSDESYEDLNWADYVKIRGIKRYYNESRSGSVYVSVYKRQES